MLDANDLKAIEALFDKKFEKIDNRLDGIDNRLDGIDTRLDAMDGRLDAMDGRLDAMDGRLDTMDGCIKKMEKRLLKEMDKRIQASENLLLTELARERKYLELRIDKLSNRIEQLEQHSRIVKHDENMTELILKKIEELQNEIERLKLKIA